MRSISMAYPTIDLAATGAHIRQLRLEQGYSVQDLQTYLGLEHPQAIYHWQHGRNLPSVDNLYALSKLWGVPHGQDHCGAGGIEHNEGREQIVPDLRFIP